MGNEMGVNTKMISEFMSSSVSRVSIARPEVQDSRLFTSSTITDP